MNGWGRRSGFSWIAKERSTVIAGVDQRLAVGYEYSEKEKIHLVLDAPGASCSRSVRIIRYHVILM